MHPMEKRILDTMAYSVKKERKRTEALIAKAIPADHAAIPSLAIAQVKLNKSDIREYCNNQIHRNSKVVSVRDTNTPFYLRQLDK